MCYYAFTRLQHLLLRSVQTLVQGRRSSRYFTSTDALLCGREVCAEKKRNNTIAQVADKKRKTHTQSLVRLQRLRNRGGGSVSRSAYEIGRRGVQHREEWERERHENRTDGSDSKWKIVFFLFFKKRWWKQRERSRISWQTRSSALLLIVFHSRRSLRTTLSGCSGSSDSSPPSEPPWLCLRHSHMESYQAARRRAVTHWQSRPRPTPSRRAELCLHCRREAPMKLLWCHKGCWCRRKISNCCRLLCFASVQIHRRCKKRRRSE